MLAFFDTYDLLLTPATVVAPFPIENRYVAEVNGHKFANYVAWCAIAYAITLACCPAMSLPCGFTRRESARRPADRRARRAARRASWPPRRRWRIFLACAARRRSIRASLDSLSRIHSTLIAAWMQAARFASTCSTMVSSVEPLAQRSHPSSRPIRKICPSVKPVVLDVHRGPDGRGHDQRSGDAEPRLRSSRGTESRGTRSPRRSAPRPRPRRKTAAARWTRAPTCRLRP